MSPSGNQQGGHYFFSFKSGRWLHRFKWKALPMPDEVIARVEDMAGDRPEGIRFTYHDMIDDPEIEYDDDGEESMGDMSYDDDEYSSNDELVEEDDDELSDGFFEEPDSDEVQEWDNEEEEI